MEDSEDCSSAARLREAGIDDVRIIEKGGDFGGTWYWNRYPGAMCDVESYVYLPLLEEVGYVPTEKYVKAREILAHSRAIGEHYALYDRALFQTEVTETRWDDSAKRWIVSTDRGDALRARFVAMANGPLHRPKLPGIEGINDYRGHTFHTSRWDYHYTGGHPDGDLDGLAGKRVGIIGTGATAVQCVPHLGAGAGELFVFQRTPSSVDVRDNRPTDPEWAASLEPGWQKHRMDNFNALVSGQPQAEDLVDDGWTDIVGKLMQMVRSGEGSVDEGDLADLLEVADLEKMNEVRARVDQVIADSSIAESLKPYYRQFCKRPCFHDEYLDTFNRPTVTLVDTDGRGIDRITERGIVANGVEYELDCIVFATGFEVGTGYSRRAGYEIIGRDGVTLTEHWADGVRTLHGMHSAGFPNNFVLSASQGGFTVNYPHLLDELAHHVAHIVGHALANGLDVVEATSDAEDALGRDDHRQGPPVRELPRELYAGLLQQRRKAVGASRPERVLREWGHRVLRTARPVAVRWSVRRPDAGLKACADRSDHPVADQGNTMNKISTDPRIDPRIKAVLGALPSVPQSDVPDRATLLAEVNTPEARAQQEQMEAMFDMVDDETIAPSAGLDISTHEFVSAPDGNTIKIQSIRPTSDEPLPCVYYIHGGGMQTMSCFNGMYRSWGRIIAQQGVAVVMVDFRNALTPSSAPEVEPFPAGLNDCVSGLRHVVAEAATFGIDPARIVVAGESGGGNLALATALQLAKDGDIGILHGVYALCPYIAGQWPQDRFPSSIENNGILLDLANNRGAVAYGIEEFERGNPLAWPSFATEADVADFPPTFISVNECDPLRDEGIEFYRLLVRAGVAAQCRQVMGTVHGTEIFSISCPDVSYETAASIANFARRT